MQLSCTCAVVLMILNCMLGPDLVNICKYVAAAPVLTRGGRDGCLLSGGGETADCTGMFSPAWARTQYSVRNQQIISTNKYHCSWRPAEGRLSLFVSSKKVVKLYEAGPGQPVSQSAGLNPIIELEGREEARPSSLIRFHKIGF